MKKEKYWDKNQEQICIVEYELDFVKVEWEDGNYRRWSKSIIASIIKKGRFVKESEELESESKYNWNRKWN